MICDRLFARHRKRILGLSLLFLVVYYFLTVRELSKSDRKLGDLPLSLTTTTSPQPRPQTKRPDRNPHYYIGDDFDEPLEVVENEELTREDLQHFPFPFNVGYTAFVGLQLNSFTTSGVAVAPWEREALIQYTMSKGEWNDTYPIAREIFPRLIQGDNLYVPSNALTPFDRYFVKQIPTNVFRRSLCDNLIRLLKVPNLPPLVVNMYTVQVGKFTLRCLYHRREELAEAPRSFVLLTSEGDVPAAQGFFRFEEMTFYPDANISFLLHHPLLKHWYSVNGNIRHPKFTAIPIGARFFHVSHGRNFLPPSDLTRGKEQFFEAEHHLHMRMFLMHLDLNKIFPHIQHTLKLGRRSCTWIEDALEIFADTSLNPNVTWIPIEKLPTRISTIYIVLMPLLTGGTTIKNGHKPSLTSEVLVFNDETSLGGTVALLPLTAAVYHKIRQNPYGSPARSLKVVTAFTVYTWREDMYYYLRNHTELTYFPPAYVGETVHFYEAANRYTFVASPLGFGYDCFRTWEALLMGAIPIVQHPDTYAGGQLLAIGMESELKYGREVNHLGLMDMLQDLPVVVIRRSDEITLENMEKWRQEIYAKAQRGEYNMTKLFMQTWIDQIYGHTAS